MCGLAGLIDFNHNSSQKILQDCTDTLAHRGADDTGYELLSFNEAQVGLGHRRLSIIDLSGTASQPMQYKNWKIIFNGEIYNYAEIRDELVALGHVFKTRSDTEVILHAWEEWKFKLVDRFIGMFVFVIFDQEKKELICFRDRAGIKPFYYYWHNNLFLFASELKAFHQHTGFEKKISIKALFQYFQYGYIMAPLTIFEHTHKLLPANYLRFSILQKEVETHPYWNVTDAYNKKETDISKEEALEHTENLLASACTYAMVADVPAGVLLSGGYDSTAVTAMIQASNTTKLKTFTIGFSDGKYNEANYAKKVASHLGTDHCEYYCTESEAQQIIPLIPLYCDEPFGDSSIIPTMLVSKLASKDVKVVLSADGGDEIFGGYNNYAVAMDFSKRMEMIPPFLRNSAGVLLGHFPGSLLQQLSGNDVAGEKKNRVSDLLKKGDLSVSNVMDHLLSQANTSEMISKLMDVDRKTIGLNYRQNTNDLKGLDKLQAIDFLSYLPDDILVKVDRATMSVSIEGREPLLDHRLVEFVATLPADLKIKGPVKKYLLKRIVHKYVPESIMDRPKMGFGVPVSDWLKNDMKFYADEYMDMASFEQHGLLNTDVVKLVMQKFYNGERSYNNLFWYLLMFQMWYKRWMN